MLRKCWRGCPVIEGRTNAPEESWGLLPRRLPQTQRIARDHSPHLSQKTACAGLRPKKPCRWASKHFLHTRPQLPLNQVSPQSHGRRNVGASVTERISRFAQRADQYSRQNGTESHTLRSFPLRRTPPTAVASRLGSVWLYTITSFLRDVFSGNLQASVVSSSPSHTHILEHQERLAFPAFFANIHQMTTNHRGQF
jgi:hypothetical protein